MTSEAYRLHVHWSARRESTGSCAHRLARMLDGLSQAHPAFERWNKQADTRAAADKPAWGMPPDVEELTKVFEKGRRRRDVPREPWPEMGYALSAWNGLDTPFGVSLGVEPGAFSVRRTFPNAVSLNFGLASATNADLISAAVLKPAMLSLIAAWEPDRGNLVCWSYWERLFGDRHYPVFRSGWMTYLAPRYASRVTPPAAAIVERVAGGGMLLLTTLERFSMDNPAHLAAADAIQAALAPIQDMVPRASSA